MQAFDSYPPAPEMNAMAQGVPGMNPYGVLPEANWGQWWSAGDVAFAESANMAAPNTFNQDQPFFNNDNYTPNQDSSTQWDSPSTSTHSYPVPSPSTVATSFDLSPGHDDAGRRESSSTQPDQRKRKRSTTTAAKSKPQPPAAKSTRRASTKKTSKTEPVAPPQKPKRGSKSKASAKLKQQHDLEDEDVEFDPEEQYDTHNKKIQERNRIASNKFRVKKREDAIKLRADEEDMERANRDLTNCVSELTLQVYELKMKLLQHTDCDCTLIQDYIGTEAQRYIKDLGDGKHPNSTPALPPPQSFYQHHHY
ncbi:hypothetical protein NW768_009919 [Fusarium equiseti]|uniref:BZIP domain-containing protein n=1 Tax=Fusarium equiseti TaxID=61235 RepID=A0ABQ8R152_FUSEQ|nr:hypothetical protein NW768_009919 [Fusarium equiseti]